MPDERLTSDVLRRADQDAALSEEARLIVLAALGDPGDLADALNRAGPPAASPPDDAPEPVGAYLKSIGVQGFRGVGANVTLPLQPGPGLVVVAGRNGSGKSTLAEALELALTGTNSRWRGKTQVWTQNWRNLHTDAAAKIRIEIAEQGTGLTTIGVDWADGADLDGHHTWVQRPAAKREAPATLGWAAALQMYRPLLSYDELSGILEGVPSAFYDQLYKLLGLEALTEAGTRLDTEVKRLKESGTELRKARDGVRQRLEEVDDPRAEQALVQLGKTKPALEQVRALITQSTTVTVPEAWRTAAGLTAPAVDCAELRAAAAVFAEVNQEAAALAADRLQLLESGLAFRERHGSQSCPVCAEGRLDDDWVQRARDAVAHEQEAARALMAARSAVHRARAAVVKVVREVGAPPTEDAELTTVAVARTAHAALAAVPVDDDVALADHVEATLPALTAAYDALRAQAATLIGARDDAWAPLAVELADWLKKSERVAADAVNLRAVTEAQKWLQLNAGQIRNERIRPLAEQAGQIWAALRQESNVELTGIELKGQKTSRRVALNAGVDGADAEAFGVMSQGELHALALAIFIPRATSNRSPFRFVVLDDPIQAMDPAKIEGFLQVLEGLAVDRQVVVFTHDDRLPAAIRRSSVPARIVSVTRGMNSTVTVTDSTRPATRMLDDAYSVATDEAVPDEIKGAAIPQLCRDALETTAWDVYSARELANGVAREDVEARWDKAKTVVARLRLAINPEAEDAVDKWKSGGAARRATLRVVSSGAHHGVQDYLGAVIDARLAVADLEKLAP